MYKQIFPNPLTSRTAKLQCGHNAFAHHIFPRLANNNGMTTIEELEASPESANRFLEWALSVTNEALPIENDMPTLKLRDISITLEAINEASLVIITLTKPTHAIGTYFIGLLAPPSSSSSPSDAIRYFTLERAAPRGTALCERVAEGDDSFTHRYLMSGPKPRESLFAEALSQYLEIENSTSGN
jgi:hypothetical protein